MDTATTPPNIKPGDKAWVTKYALTTGITEESVLRTLVYDDKTVYAKLPGYSSLWVTKYALTTGITEESVLRTLVYDDKTVYAKLPGYSSLFKVGRDCFPDYTDAIADAEKRRTAKIASLRKQIAKLEALTFAEVAP